LTSIGLRWVQHHSLLGPEDGVIIGAASLEQLQQNLADSEEGPLPEDILAALDEASKIVGLQSPPYFR
jgi:aflatoxin B1 aldehyde reductase